MPDDGESSCRGGAKKYKPAEDPTLRGPVARRLSRGWSPPQISGRLRATFGESWTVYVSHETIDKSLFIEIRGVLTTELAAHLRSRRGFGRGRRSTTKVQPRGHIKDAVPFRERLAEDRAVPARCEGGGLDHPLPPGHQRRCAPLPRREGFPRISCFPSVRWRESSLTAPWACETFYVVSARTLGRSGLVATSVLIPGCTLAHREPHTIARLRETPDASFANPSTKSLRCVHTRTGERHFTVSRNFVVASAR